MRDFWTWLKETYEEGDPNWWKPQEDRDDELLNNLGDEFGFNVPKRLSDTQKMNRQWNPPRKADPYSWNAWHGQSSSHTDQIFMQDIQYHIRDAITNNNGLWCTMPIWGLNGMRQTDPETGDRHPNDDNSGDVIKNIAYIEVMKNNDVINAFHLDADMPVDSFMNHEIGGDGGNSRDDLCGDPSEDHYDPNDSDMVKETLSRILDKVKIVIGGSMDQDERSSGKNNQFVNDAHIVYMELQSLNQEQLLQRMQNLQRMTADQAAQSIIDYCKKKLGTGY